MPTGPQTIDEYLATLNAEQRAALEKLRRDIRAALPEGEECISYQLPSFRVGGRYLLSFGAAAKHCSFFPGVAPIEACREELAAYGLSKGTIRFSAESPLPAALVRKLVKIQLAAKIAPQPAARKAPRMRAAPEKRAAKGAAPKGAGRRR